MFFQLLFELAKGVEVLELGGELVPYGCVDGCEVCCVVFGFGSVLVVVWVCYVLLARVGVACAVVVDLVDSGVLVVVFGSVLWGGVVDEGVHFCAYTVDV